METSYETLVKAGWKPLPDKDRRIGTAEYWRRLREGVPVRSPHFQAGDLVYSWSHKANVRVVSVSWDKGWWGCGSFWRVNLPGFSDRDINFTDALPDAPTCYYEEISPHCWALRRVTQGKNE